jgi:hypothetical protein
MPSALQTRYIPVIDTYSCQQRSFSVVGTFPHVFIKGLMFPLTSEHSNFHFEACAGGVTLQAAAGSEKTFPQGLIVMNAASGMTFCGIGFLLPLAPFGSTVVATPATPQTIQVFVAIGLRPASCTQLTIEDCGFFFTFPSGQSGSVQAGIFAGGNCQGLRLARNRFVPSISFVIGAAPLSAGLTGNNFFAGFALFPSTVSTSVSPTVPMTSGSAKVLTSSLHDASFRDNLFESLTVPAIVHADCGRIEIEANNARNCPDGFALLSLPSLALLNNLSTVNVPAAASSTAGGLQTALLTAVGLSASQLGNAIFRGFPLPDNFDLSKAIPVTLADSGPVIRDGTLLQSVFDRTLTFAFRPADQPAGTAPQVVTLGNSVLATTGFTTAAAATGQFNPTILNQSYSTFEKLAFANATPTVAPLVSAFLRLRFQHHRAGRFRAQPADLESGQERSGQHHRARQCFFRRQYQRSHRAGNRSFAQYLHGQHGAQRSQPDYRDRPAAQPRQSVAAALERHEFHQQRPGGRCNGYGQRVSWHRLLASAQSHACTAGAHGYLALLQL